MKKFVVIAAMLMASASAAHAGSFSFNVEGQKVRVHIPRGCSSLSCINVSAPGLADKFNKDKDSDDSSSSTTTTTATAPAAAPAPAPAPAPQIAAAAPVAPAPAAAPQASPKVTVLPPPAAEPAAAPTISAPPLTAPEVSAQPAPAPVAAPAPTPAPVQMAAVPTAPAVAAPAPVQTASTPVGVWMSEKKEGKIRVEDCGGNLCGYAIEKSGAKGAKVLINMKPRGDKWVGRIHDTRSGGTYDSTIALRGNDKLKVQGCAMGGMFCGGETWTRIE
jgi:uncharacterized protein (DUF2147 family)